MPTRFFRHSLIAIVMVAALGSMAYGQLPVNNPIDPADTELNDAVHFLSNYLNEFTPGKQFLPDFSRYWPAEDCQRYRIPDRLIYAVSAEIPTYMLGKPTILSARPENGSVHIKTMFSRVDSAGQVMVSAITNHYVLRGADGHLQFMNPMKMAQQKWNTSEVNNFIYHYPSYHKFDKSKAKALAGKTDQLEKEWNLQPILITYYFADTREEIEHYRGFDFTIAMGNRDKPSGISDGIDNIIYCGGMGEDYFHEVVHLYLNKLFPRSPLTEGLAVFYGGSLGHELSWHLQRLNEYLSTHPAIDLNDPDSFYYMDNYTNPLSTLQGMLCLMAYKKDGIAGLKRTMKYTTLTALLREEYGVERAGWNTFLRSQIAANSKE